MPRPLFRVFLLFTCLGLSPTLTAQARDIELPSLGDATSGIVSKQQEYELGRAWLQAFRSRVKPFEDPLLQEYLENLVLDLATHSDLTELDLELVIVKNPTINAFAVPGGVVGVHTGLFRYAENEDQIAAVMAHELAHLSQRHFARSVAEQKKNSTLALAGLLATVVLAASGSGDGAMAALATTRAAALENQLRYSRQNEQEADRLGMETLYRSGRDPSAAGDMFSIMQRTFRYLGTNVPEFLRSHPLTEKRINDARNRVHVYPKRQYQQNDYYDLMKARALVSEALTPRQGVAEFEAKLAGNERNSVTAQYGLVLALMAAERWQEAKQKLEPLLERFPTTLALQLDMAKIDSGIGRHDLALARLDKARNFQPRSYPLLMAYGQIQWNKLDYDGAADTYKLLTEMRPSDPQVWYNLAEVRGLEGDIAEVHLARAEYFVLVGAYPQAQEHLGRAEKLLEQDARRSAVIRQRIRDVGELLERAEAL